MVIEKNLSDDKKCKHSSIEMKIIVPAMLPPKSMLDIGGYSSSDRTEYISHHASMTDANAVFRDFLKAMSKHYNTHYSTFEVWDTTDYTAEHYQYRMLCERLEKEWFSITTKNWQSHYERLKERGA